MENIVYLSMHKNFYGRGIWINLGLWETTHLPLP